MQMSNKLGGYENGLEEDLYLYILETMFIFLITYSLQYLPKYILHMLVFQMY